MRRREFITLLGARPSLGRSRRARSNQRHWPARYHSTSGGLLEWRRRLQRLNPAGRRAGLRPGRERWYEL